MEKIKRYEPGGYSEREQNVCMFEWEDGKWVKYDDIKHLLEKPKCNCPEKLERLPGFRIEDMIYYDRWFCPVHGYKKI